jgi:RNA polymerase sigma-70 factor (ECF subfamily)
MAMPHNCPSAEGQRAGVFQTTRWSLVLLAGEGDSEAAQSALGRLCEAYWPPLYAFARHDGLDSHAAQDAVQGFLARILARGDIAQVTPKRGRFRSFLIGSFKNFLSSLARADHAQKRGGGVLPVEIDAGLAEGMCAPALIDVLTPDRAFDRQWARTVMSRALDRLRAEHASPAAARIFAALQPTLAEGARLTDADALASKLGTTSGALATAATRLRQRYRALIEDEVAQTLDDRADLAEELQALRAAWL